MDAKPEYIRNLASFLTRKNASMEDNELISSHIEEFLSKNRMMLCRQTGFEEKKNEHKNTPCVEMFYEEFNGHVYLMDRKNRVFTANKENPVEIGYVEEKDGERKLVKYEQFNHL